MILIFLPILHFFDLELSPFKGCDGEGEDGENKVNGPSEINGNQSNVCDYTNRDGENILECWRDGGNEKDGDVEVK